MVGKYVVKGGNVYYLFKILTHGFSLITPLSFNITTKIIIRISPYINRKDITATRYNDVE